MCLERGEAWLVDADPDAWLETHGYGRAFEGLADSERERARRFRRQSDQHMYVAAHAILRRRVSDIVGVAPTELVFTHDAGKRPELLDPKPCGLRFNLSHTRGRVALILTRGRACGVDVEHLDRRLKTDELGPTVYAPAELTWLAAAAGTHRKRDRFFRLWTVKEAYSKARGLGLALDFPAYEFDFPEQDLPRLMRSPEGPAEAMRWCFGSSAPTGRHRMAWAVARDAGGAEPRLVRMDEGAW